MLGSGTFTGGGGSCDGVDDDGIQMLETDEAALLVCTVELVEEAGCELATDEGVELAVLLFMLFELAWLDTLLFTLLATEDTDEDLALDAGVDDATELLLADEAAELVLLDELDDLVSAVTAPSLK